MKDNVKIITDKGADDVQFIIFNEACCGIKIYAVSSKVAENIDFSVINDEFDKYLYPEIYEKIEPFQIEGTIHLYNYS